jgi:hypothetical protein
MMMMSVFVLLRRCFDIFVGVYFTINLSVALGQKFSTG